jgi:hypothetical protein
MPKIEAIIPSCVHVVEGMVEPIEIMLMGAWVWLGEFDANKGKDWSTRGHGPDKLTNTRTVQCLHAFGKLCLVFGIWVTRSSIDFFEQSWITWKRGRTSSGHLVQRHPRNKMFLETFVDEGFTRDLDIIPRLRNIYSVIHVEVALAFNRNS